jgi:hypothetical protein
MLVFVEVRSENKLTWHIITANTHCDYRRDARSFPTNLDLRSKPKFVKQTVMLLNSEQKNKEILKNNFSFWY